jgi:hypothetical protein
LVNKLFNDHLHSSVAGGTVEQLRAEQTSLNEVLITWDPPTHLPARGYQFIQLIEANTIDVVLSRTARSHTITLESGIVDVSVLIRPISDHYPSTAKSVVIRVRGESMRDAIQ